MEERASASQARRKISLRVTDKEHDQLAQEARDYGYDFSTLLRLKLFGTLKGMRITRRPSADMMVLGDLIGRLTRTASELNKIGSNLNQIAKRVNQGSRDLFGLDGGMRTLERIGQELTRALGLIEDAIMRKKIKPEEE